MKKLKFILGAIAISAFALTFSTHQSVASDESLPPGGDPPYYGVCCAETGYFCQHPNGMSFEDSKWRWGSSCN
jgi:hypothetical protein